MAMPVQAPKRLFTVNEFYQMAEAGILREDDRVELVAGEVVEMTPIGSRHAACVSRLNRLFSQRLGEECIVRVQGPVRLDEDAELSELPALRLALSLADDQGRPATTRNLKLWLSEDARRLPLRLEVGLPVGHFALA